VKGENSNEHKPYKYQLSLTNPCNVLQTKVDAQCHKLVTELS